MKKIKELTGINTTYIGQYMYNKHKEMNPKMIERILELSEKYPSNKHSNELGWQSKRDFYREECVADLGGFVRECLNKYIEKNIDTSIIKDWRITDLWANICPKYSYHKRHTHPNSDLSGAYYIQVPKSAPELIFTNPHRYMRPLIIGSADTAVSPKEGLIVIFDSGIEHEVNINLSDEPRISLAFNCQINKK